MNSKKLFLCVCQYGHSRSVCLARVLHGRGYQAIAAGTGTAGAWFELLCERADTICLLDDALLHAIPPQFRVKVLRFHVGADRWSNPYHPELNAILAQLCDQYGIVDERAQAK